jgi:hypothetical protein
LRRIKKLRFEWFWVGRLRGGERAAAFAGDEGGSEGGGSEEVREKP